MGNLKYFFGALTSNRIEQLSGGKIKRMTPKQAAGLIGSWIVETGSRDLTDLDVVEKVAGAGRGLSQYTGARRVAYDIERAKALRHGKNPNSPEWQLQYFVDEYTGKHDRHAGGKSLIGWTGALSGVPEFSSAAEASEFFTGSAAEGRGYFRPGVTHQDKRNKEAERVYGLLGGEGGSGEVSIPEITQASPTEASEGVSEPSQDKPFSIPELLINSVKSLGIQL
jgi:hypothetical protein